MHQHIQRLVVPQLAVGSVASVAVCTLHNKTDWLRLQHFTALYSSMCHTAASNNPKSICKHLTCHPPSPKRNYYFLLRWIRAYHQQLQAHLGKVHHT